jgi:hypothetical protein
VVGQKLALRHASAVQVTAFGCFTGTAACLPFTGQFLSQLGSAPVSTTMQVVYLGLCPTTLGTPDGRVAGGAFCLAGVAVSRSRSRVDRKASAQPAEATSLLGAYGAIDTWERNM